MSLAVVVSVVLALAALGYVLYPLVRGWRGEGGLMTHLETRVANRELVRPVSDDEIEAAVRSYRLSRGRSPACDVCGGRPEPDAVFCSSCGRRLPTAAGVGQRPPSS